MSNGPGFIMDEGDLTAAELGQFEIIPGAMDGEQSIRPISSAYLLDVLSTEEEAE